MRYTVIGADDPCATGVREHEGELVTARARIDGHESRCRYYYEILEVSSEASSAEIKRAHRRLAFQTHPDRNRNVPRTEQRFKAISETYGVLSDPGTRAQYDRYRKLGYRQNGAGQGYHQTGFGYSQEEILRDLFSGSHARDVFVEMQKEFQRMGFRFDEKFINNLFFGGKTIFFQGVIWGGGKGTGIFRSNRFYQTT